MKTTNFYKDKNVFVTGGFGFMGSWLVKRLIKEGANVVVIKRDEPRKFSQPIFDESKVISVRGDITDPKIVERIINEYEIEIVFHLAAQAIVATANRSPLSTFDTNIMGTAHVLEACRNINTVKRIVVASSDKAYGENENLPYYENFPMQGKHPYDVSKSCADLIARSYYYTYKLPLVVTRFANLYGGGDMNFNRIIPGTIRSLINNEEPIIRSDGTFKRDYLYVEDAAEAYLVLGAADANKVVGEAFNVGNDVPVSVIDLVNKIIGASGKKDIKPKILNQAIGEIKDQFLCSKKMLDTLGWKPKFSLDTGIRKSYEWYYNYITK